MGAVMVDRFESDADGEGDTDLEESERHAGARRRGVPASED